MADQVGSGTVHGAVSESAGLEPQMQGLARTETLGASPWKHESFSQEPPASNEARQKNLNGR